MTIRHSIFANYAGQVWITLMNFIFVPLYLKYLGIEAYGVMGIYNVLQTWVLVLDFGLGQSLGREMAGLKDNTMARAKTARLLRTVESALVLIALSVWLLIGLASDWMASHWLSLKLLQVGEVRTALILVGLLCSLRLMEGMYINCLIGMQRQIAMNTIQTVGATVRWGGAAAVVIFYSQSIIHFLLWQLGTAVFTLVCMSWATHHHLSDGVGGQRWHLTELKSVRTYASGMFAVTLIGLALTQMDKLVLLHFFNLEDFGYYALAVTVASAVFVTAVPITQAYFPRYHQLASTGNAQDTSQVYHQTCQLISVVTGSCSIALAVFSETILQFWTGNTLLAAQVAPLVSVLALGNLFNVLITPAVLMQYAHSWTSNPFRVKFFTAVMYFPALLILISRHGIMGAAIGWMLMNALLILLIGFFMHRRILVGERYNWATQDVLRPLTWATVGIVSVKQGVAFWTNVPPSIMTGAFGLLCGTLLAVAGTPHVRNKLRSPFGNI